MSNLSDSKPSFVAETDNPVQYNGKVEKGKVINALLKIATKDKSWKTNCCQQIETILLPIRTCRRIHKFEINQKLFIIVSYQNK